MKLPLLIVAAALLISGCQAYRAYDRSHARRVDVSYDADSQTVDLGYTITPLAPVKGFAK